MVLGVPEVIEMLKKNVNGLRLGIECNLDPNQAAGTSNPVQARFDRLGQETLKMEHRTDSTWLSGFNNIYLSRGNLCDSSGKDFNGHHVGRNTIICGEPNSRDHAKMCQFADILNSQNVAYIIDLRQQNETVGADYTPFEPTKYTTGEQSAAFHLTRQQVGIPHYSDSSAKMGLLKASFGESLQDIKYLNFPIPDFKAPQSINDLHKIASKICKARDEVADQGSDKKLLVHCRAGVGRSGTLTGAADVLQLYKDRKLTADNWEDQVDNCILDLRRQRSNMMVQDFSQYVALRNYAERLVAGAFDTSIRGASIGDDSKTLPQAQLHQIGRQFQFTDAGVPPNASRPTPPPRPSKGQTSSAEQAVSQNQPTVLAAPPPTGDRRPPPPPPPKPGRVSAEFAKQTGSHVQRTGEPGAPQPKASPVQTENTEQTGSFKSNRPVSPPAGSRSPVHTPQATRTSVTSAVTKSKKSQVKNQELQDELQRWVDTGKELDAQIDKLKSQRRTIRFQLRKFLRGGKGNEEINQAIRSLTVARDRVYSHRTRLDMQNADILLAKRRAEATLQQAGKGR